MRRFLVFSTLMASCLFSASAQDRWGIIPTKEEIEYRKANPKPTPPSTKKTTAEWSLPPDARFAAEFEESQAVCLAWVYDYQPPFPIDVSSEYAHLWGDMATAIQAECAVWIRIDQGADSTAVKNFMASRGTPLTNYRFILSVGDDFWVRDFGPLTFYHGTDDKIGFLDMNYYSGRENDDVFPADLADALGITNVRTNLYAEGGNYITDGLGKSFHSDRIYAANGFDEELHPTWSTARTKDTLAHVWASKSVVATPELKCDGGTGHNDMFMKLMDEETFAIMEYPENVGSNDRQIIQNVIAQLSQEKNAYGRPYRIFKVPMPTRDNGQISTTCASINNDARTFVNGTTVNKTYLMPAFSGASTGNKAGDDAAKALFEKIAPGYKVVPLDSRGLTILGGAIHCVNMQIPADNPINFWHPAIRDMQPKLLRYRIVSKITNKSGISSAKCYWRKKGNTNWNTVNLTDSSGYLVGDIRGTFKHPDAVEYYLSATSNNGKTMTKPITAANGGYYTFYMNWPQSVNELDGDKNFVLNPLPNPSNGTFMVPVSFESSRRIEATVLDVYGKKVASADFGTRERGMNQLDFDISNAAPGMYFVQISIDGQLFDTKRVLKQ
jgi:agmatine/peptidylarginine deiminase